MSISLADAGLPEEAVRLEGFGSIADIDGDITAHRAGSTLNPAADRQCFPEAMLTFAACTLVHAQQRIEERS
ncbi:MAG: hypothetical protein HKN95_09260 [Acidimicrobiia bacterium]|nr:hypothetical protein [Acidimicrobiia bacterium]